MRWFTGLMAQAGVNNNEKADHFCNAGQEYVENGDGTKRFDELVGMFLEQAKREDDEEIIF
jgi:hypothetical protein